MKVNILNDGNKEFLIASGNTISIQKGYYKNKCLDKTIQFSMWSDFGFTAYGHDSNCRNKVSFDFYNNDPLYFCLDRFMGNEDIITIDDDQTFSSMHNYMQVIRDTEAIKIIFNDIDRKNNNNRFNVFVRNIENDYRSKISDGDIKNRLIRFFEEASLLLKSDYKAEFNNENNSLRLNNSYNEAFSKAKIKIR